MFNYLKVHRKNIPVISTTAKIDKAIEELTNEVSSALKNCTKIITLSYKTPIVLPQRIRALIKEKRKARKKAQRTCDPEDFRQATLLNNEVCALLKTYYDESWSNKVSTLNTDQAGLWKMAKALRTNKVSIPPLQINEGKKSPRRVFSWSLPQAKQLSKGCQRNLWSSYLPL